MCKSSLTIIAKSTLVAFIALILQLPAFAHSLQANYIPWGVDEYEFFGLTTPELAKDFKGKMEFEQYYTRAYFPGYRHAGFGQPQFELTFDKGKVVRVRRLLVDGAGCNIEGPNLSSKKEALLFSVDGLTKLANRDRNDDARLKAAKQMLAEIDNAKLVGTKSK
jgi:hypothetical protein